MIGAPTDGELRAELATATPERREVIESELESRARGRAVMRGHDPNLCEHPVRCEALS